jgi:hypothetical protein
MDPDQTARVRKLVWIHAGRKPIMLVLSWRGSNNCVTVSIDQAVTQNVISTKSRIDIKPKNMWQFSNVPYNLNISCVMSALQKCTGQPWYDVLIIFFKSDLSMQSPHKRVQFPLKKQRKYSCRFRNVSNYARRSHMRVVYTFNVFLLSLLLLFLSVLSKQPPYERVLCPLKSNVNNHVILETIQKEVTCVLFLHSGFL